MRLPAIITWTFPVIALLATTPALSEETTTIEKGTNGLTYKVTRRVVERTVPQTEYQPREEKVYQPQVATQVQTYQQQYLTPVTEYRWVARLRGMWNPFVDPYWSYELEPHTRWESRPATVQVPTPQTEWVERRRVTQVPVTTYRKVQDVIEDRVVVHEPATGVRPPASLSPDSGATQVAARPLSSMAPQSAFGSQKLENDPPSDGWGPATTSDDPRYRR